MHNDDPALGRQVNRRAFLKGSIIAGGAVVGAGAAIKAVADATSEGGSVQPPRATRGSASATARKQGPPPGSSQQPNILVIVVDQLRYPMWFSAAQGALGFAPNLQRLRSGAVSFARHYTASNDCTPARSTLLTGLYTHQTGCMITGGSTLDPGFPTWGSMLREHGYHTRWFGKWHLTHHDNRWTELSGEAALEKYGFAGGVYPSPDGAPGQGWRRDPHIAHVLNHLGAGRIGNRALGVVVGQPVIQPRRSFHGALVGAPVPDQVEALAYLRLSFPFHLGNQDGTAFLQAAGMHAFFVAEKHGEVRHVLGEAGHGNGARREGADGEAELAGLFWLARHKPQPLYWIDARKCMNDSVASLKLKPASRE